MTINIKKENEICSLSIQSGHFTGTLFNIPKSSLKELSDNIQEILKEESSFKDVVWNPRSQRHEYINNSI